MKTHAMIERECFKAIWMDNCMFHWLLNRKCSVFVPGAIKNWLHR